jgi:hypothetical protein
VPGHVDTSTLLSGPSIMDFLTVLRCDQSQLHVPHRPPWNLKLRSARLPSWLIGLRRACYAIRLRHFKTADGPDSYLFREGCHTVLEFTDFNAVLPDSSLAVWTLAPALPDSCAQLRLRPPRLGMAEMR